VAGSDRDQPFLLEDKERYEQYLSAVDNENLIEAKTFQFHIIIPMSQKLLARHSNLNVATPAHNHVDSRLTQKAISDQLLM
jgi:hypothetical protein